MSSCARSRQARLRASRRRANTASAWFSCRWTPASAKSAKKRSSESCARKDSVCSDGATCRSSNPRAAISRGAGCPRSARSSSGAAPDLADAEALERKLYVIRKRATNAAENLGLFDPELFYFCSLSALTIVYKGQLISTQMPAVLPRPARSRHSRPRLRWSISASPPTLSRAGTARIRIASWRTTAKSTRCAATSTGCMRARSCSPRRCSATTSRSCCRSSRPTAATPRCSTTVSSC